MLKDMIDKTVQVAAKILPTGRWSRAYTLSGKQAGLRFECDRCHLVIGFEAPERVLHCGHEEERPSLLVPSGEAQKASSEDAYRVRFIG